MGFDANPPPVTDAGDKPNLKVIQIHPEKSKLMLDIEDWKIIALSICIFLFQIKLEIIAAFLHFLTSSVSVSGESRGGGDVGGAVVVAAVVPPHPLPPVAGQRAWTCGSDETH